MKKRYIIWPVIILTLAILSFIFYSHIQLNKIKEAPTDNIPYSIRGVDVSAYQGTIDWPTLASEDIAFAFIKATEGSDFVDPNFSKNWKGAQKTDLRIGAYHFLSFDSEGKDQSANFIENVPKTSGMLPPVIDIELYGDYVLVEPNEETVHQILGEINAAFKEAYGTSPIIYTTPHLYTKYISGNYDNPIWISDSTLPSTLSDGASWTFCQYSYTGQLSGYEAGVPHIDLNVFNGTKRDFLRLK